MKKSTRIYKDKVRKEREIVRIETDDLIILLDVSRFPPGLLPNSANKSTE